MSSTESEIVQPKVFSRGYSRDVDDDNVIGTAYAGECECIITGDNDLLELGEVMGIKILTPRQFFDDEQIT